MTTKLNALTPGIRTEYDKLEEEYCVNGCKIETLDDVDMFIRQAVKNFEKKNKTGYPERDGYSVGN